MRRSPGALVSRESGLTRERAPSLQVAAEVAPINVEARLGSKRTGYLSGIFSCWDGYQSRAPHLAARPEAHPGGLSFRRIGRIGEPTKPARRYIAWARSFCMSVSSVMRSTPSARACATTYFKRASQSRNVPCWPGSGAHERGKNSYHAENPASGGSTMTCSPGARIARRRSG